jgi:hypothetical protein
MKKKERQRARSDLGAEEFRVLLQWTRKEADVELNGQRHGTCRTCSSSVPTPSHTPTEPPSPAKNRA